MSSPVFVTAKEKELVIGTMQEVDTSHESFQHVQAAYQHIGYDIRLLPMPYARSFYESNRGIILDGELARTEVAAHQAPDMIRIPVPIDESAAAVFTNDPHFYPNDWADLHGKRIDVLKGTSIIIGRLGDLPYNTVTTLEQAFLRLNSGRSDALIAPGSIAQEVLNNMQVSGIYRVTPDLETWLVYHYIHKRHENLVEPLTQALQQVMQHETFVAIQ
ncbi:substrate-binding periplasmic protein [Aliidiomarina taiwanensis]|uniref:substrate-binding periplasmic protein n=1 Tax=Aliidiomarina taiwanensis TaxID=946228 RepID=UPI0013006893|nr:transporter substrate-binding domain-containing protein [Aliidiomarina taiwanensis]